MMKRRTLVLMLGMALGGTVLAAPPDELGAVEKEIYAAWEKHKSMTAKLTMETHMEMRGMVVEGKGTGTFEFMRKGAKLLSRAELQNSVVQKMGTQETRMDQARTTVVDGDYAYTLHTHDMMGQKSTTAVKSDINPQMSGDPKSTFEQLREDYTLKLLPEESVDGEKVYVVEAVPKEQAANPTAPTKLVFYFNQNSGFMVKMVAHGPDGKPMQTISFSEIKLDVDLKPERFVFKAPEGVEVLDRTGQEP